MRLTVFFLFGWAYFLLNPIQASNSNQTVIEKIIDNTELSTSLMDLSASPNAIVGGAVNVITGNYFESESDLVIPGPIPFILQRSYNSSNYQKGILCQFWELNHPSKFYTQDTKLYTRGSRLIFNPLHKAELRVSSKQLKYGITNCSAGILSSRTNIKNRKIFKKNNSHYEMLIESGDVVNFSKYKSRENLHKEKYHSTCHRLANKCYFTYSYDEDDRIKSVIGKGPNGNHLSHIKWHFPHKFEHNPILELTSSDGRNIVYKYLKLSAKSCKKHCYVLTSVTRDHAPKVEYKYRNEGSLKDRLVKKILPDNRYLNIDYYDEGRPNLFGREHIQLFYNNDLQEGRVSTLHAPVGKDASPILIWSFKYNMDQDSQKNNPLGGTTEVIDANGHRKKYRYSDEQRLTSIKHYCDDGQLYREEKMIWGEPELENENIFLMSRGITDDVDALLARKDYKYDEHGNVLKETFRGNLTGNQGEQIDWEEFRSSEVYTKIFKYTGKGLLKSETDGKKETRYEYVGDTDLISLKLILNHNEICERYYYEYDANCTLIKEVSDDGSSSNINDLRDVSERRIKRITPTTVQPIGLPEVVEEYFFCPTTGVEDLIKRHENIYSKEGYLRSQKIYDSERQFCYSKKWRYDAHGNVLEETDPLGQVTTYKYDINNNRIFRQTPNLEYYTTFSYDYVNRLVGQRDIYANGTVRKKGYSYDYMGNRTAIIDEYGNTTKFRYDEFGRLVEKIHPPLLGLDGRLFNPIDKVAYDCLNNPIEKTDTNGNVTKTCYTAWGKPYLITYPDGAVESHEYQLDGTLEKTIHTDGSITLYTHDYKGRKIREEKLSPLGESLYVHQFIYNANHLVSEIDPAGYKTEHIYDLSGQLIMTKKGNSETKYCYDKMGRRSKVFEAYEPQKYRITSYEYDILDRVTSELVMDNEETIFSRKSYVYDVDGNRTETIIHDNHDNVCTKVKYNPEKKPIKIILPDGIETHTIYHYDFINDLGQNVAALEEIDPEGVHSLKVMDACGRLAKEEKRDALGRLLQRNFQIHDGEGNLVRRTDEVIIDEELQRKLKLEYKYDSKNRVISIIEAAGDPLEKVTKKEYNNCGELSKIIKRDGTIIFHEYDYLGRLVDLRSSDGTIHYHYLYDLRSNIIRVDDFIHGMGSNRIFDNDNWLLTEELGTSLKFQYQNDALGRIQQLLLPDLSKVTYSYNAAKLVAVDREKGEKLLHWAYSYNLSGKLAKIELPNDLGSINYSYNCSLRPIRLESSYWSQYVPEGGYNSLGSLVKSIQSDTAGELVSNYKYDSLNHIVMEDGVADHIYQFDSLHNRINKDGTKNSVNALNQLTGFGDKTYEYDLNGNQSIKSTNDQEAKYRYDALDRLIAVIFADKKTEYIYDSFNRRLRKKHFELQADEWVETDSQTYLYFGDREIGVVDRLGQVIELRTLGLGGVGDIGATVLIEIGDQLLCPIHDFRGNITALVDVQKRKTIEGYRYTTFGEEQIFDGDGNIKQNSISPWRFSSKRVDAETGWSFFGRRYYDAEIGKWTTPDPIGFNDGPNVYCFVRNNPMMFIDPDGRSSVPTGPNIGSLERAGQYWSYNKFEVFCNIFLSSFMKIYDDDSDGIYMPFEAYSEIFTVGTRQNNGLGFIGGNGICNSRDCALKAATNLSNMAKGNEVQFVYNASHGFVFDLVECALGLVGIETYPVTLCREAMTNCKEQGYNKTLSNAHSQGGIIARLAAYGLDRDTMKDINFIGIASAAHMPFDLFGNAIHLESKRDFVPSLDACSMLMNGSDTIVKLDPHADAPFWDHPCDSPTFAGPWEKLIDDFIDTYGGL